MILNSKAIFYILIAFFLISNVYAYIYIINTPVLNGGFQGYQVSNFDNIHISFFLVMFFYFIIFMFLYLLQHMKSNSELETLSNNQQNILSKIIFVLLLLLLYAVISEGAGTAGGEELGGQTLLSTALSLFRIDLLAIIFLMTFPQVKLFYHNLLLFMVITVLQGWLGGGVVALVMYLLKTRPRVKDIIFSKAFIFSLIIMFILPWLMEARNIYRVTDELSFDFNTGIGFLAFFDSIHILFFRFQQLETIIYFLDNYDYFFSIYSAEVTPVYFQGIIPNKIYDVFFGTNTQSLGYILFSHSHDVLYGRKSALTSGMLTHILLDIYVPVYILIIFALNIFIASKFKVGSGARFCLTYYMMMLFAFGWINAYFSFLMMLIFYLLSLIIAKKLFLYYRFF